MKPTDEQRRRKMRKRGWSEKRIDQYIRDTKFHIPPTRSPHGRNNEQKR